MLCTAKTTLKWGYLLKIKRRGRKIINHHTVEGTRESHPRVHDLQHPRLGKPRRGLQIMDTQMGFPCPFHSVVIDSIILLNDYTTTFLRVLERFPQLSTVHNYRHPGYREINLFLVSFDFLSQAIISS